MSHLLPGTTSFTDDLTPPEREALERQTIRIGMELFEQLGDDRPHVLERRWWDERLLAWSMHDEALKVSMFRFVDVLPMLTSSSDVVEHLNEYLGDEELPAGLRMLLGTVRRLPFTAPAVARAVRLGAADLARRFIAGENVPQVLAAAQLQRKLGRAFTLDILGEAVVSEKEAEDFERAYLHLIESVAPVVNAWPHKMSIDEDDRGPIPRMNLSIKLSALDSQFDALDIRGSLARAGERFRNILRVAMRQSAFVNVDMESYAKKDLTLYIFEQVLSEPEFRDFADVGIVIQCYLHDAGRDLLRLAAFAQRRGTPIWVRIVKGAYWDYETILALSHGWPPPVFQQKWQSDANFERQTRFLLQNSEWLRPALGTHNLRSIAHGLAAAKHYGLPAKRLELQMLYGMADGEKVALVNHGHRLRVYMPYGELLPGMSYLVRRLLENTANDSFLRAGFVERISPTLLLKNPEELAPKRRAMPLEPVAVVVKPFTPPIVNEPPVDFTIAANREAMDQALQQVASVLGQSFPLAIDGDFVLTAEQIESHNPSRLEQLVGTTSSATTEHVNLAVAAAVRALPAWQQTPVVERAACLRRAATGFRQRKFELAAWIIFECGKPWRDATADVDEAIDFCEYYAAEAVAFMSDQGVDIPGEENRFDYLPRGVCGVIAPWNFPLAILTGMTTAALVTGNTVIMKPAEQSPVIASLAYEVLRDAGIPPGVLHYLPGRGEVAGAALVDHPDVALIAFTGSRNVGLAINARAAELSRQGMRNVKRVIAEMGGKNAIIVDSDADLDEAVLGVMKSAFNYQGQKCSACSRAIVLADVHDAFVQRLIGATNSLQIAPADDPASSIGPVIDAESRDRIGKYIELGRSEATLVLARDVGSLAEQGHFVGPHIFTNVQPHSRLAQEEIFGPVLSIIKAENFDDALRIANDVDYALTGGVFSRHPGHLAQARREFLVGNLYLNRAITGALVGRQPFGGFKMSGIGSKAGGKDYLLQFVVPRTITEHTVRRGFAPTLPVVPEQGM
jgi:RHH-type proline utilization regulon transcriptional repressor/proline dehydrogenase/delta 1-pyrroline-5-carboxylate dehydrogenase